MNKWTHLQNSIVANKWLFILSSFCNLLYRCKDFDLNCQLFAFKKQKPIFSSINGQFDGRFYNKINLKMFGKLFLVVGVLAAVIGSEGVVQCRRAARLL